MWWVFLAAWNAATTAMIVTFTAVGAVPLFLAPFAVATFAAMCVAANQAISERNAG